MTDWEKVELANGAARILRRVAGRLVIGAKVFEKLAARVQALGTPALARWIAEKQGRPAPTVQESKAYDLERRERIARGDIVTARGVSP